MGMDESDQKLRVAAVQAMERLLRAAARDPDRLTLQRFVARYVGRNPNAIEPLNPDSAIVAERDKAQAMVADLKGKLAQANDRADTAQAALRALQTQQKTTELTLRKVQRKAARNATPVPAQPREYKTKPDRRAYQRELMRRKRAEMKAAPKPAADLRAP